MIFDINVIRVSFKNAIKRNYGKLPAKHTQIQPWEMLCIDLIGKYRMTTNKRGRNFAMKVKKDKDFYLQAITIILPG